MRVKMIVRAAPVDAPSDAELNSLSESMRKLGYSGTAIYAMGTNTKMMKRAIESATLLKAAHDREEAEWINSLQPGERGRAFATAEAPVDALPELPKGHDPRYFHPECFSADEMRDYARAAQALVRATPRVGAWISVDDRLPEPMTMVLAAFEMDRPGDWRIKCASYEPESKDGNVQTNGGWRIVGGSWTPTRWKPLPPPPCIGTQPEADSGEAQS